MFFFKKQQQLSKLQTAMRSEDIFSNDFHSAHLDSKKVLEKSNPKYQEAIYNFRNQEDNEGNRKTYSKWSSEDKKIYWFGLLMIADQNPYCKLSWENWKIDRCFKKMELLFKGRKTNTQIKSFDQRMKKQFMKNKNIDLMEAIVEALKNIGLTQEQQKKLTGLTIKSKFKQLDTIATYIEKELLPECLKDKEEMQIEYNKFFQK